MSREIETFRCELLCVNMRVVEGSLFGWALYDWQSENRSLAEPSEENVITASLSPTHMWHIEQGVVSSLKL